MAEWCWRVSGGALLLGHTLAGHWSSPHPSRHRSLGPHSWASLPPPPLPHPVSRNWPIFGALYLARAAARRHCSRPSPSSSGPLVGAHRALSLLCCRRARTPTRGEIFCLPRSQFFESATLALRGSRDLSPSLRSSRSCPFTSPPAFFLAGFEWEGEGASFLRGRSLSQSDFLGSWFFLPRVLTPPTTSFVSAYSSVDATRGWKWEGGRFSEGFPFFGMKFWSCWVVGNRYLRISYGAVW